MKKSWQRGRAAGAARTVKLITSADYIYFIAGAPTRAVVGVIFVIGHSLRHADSSSAGDTGKGDHLHCVEAEYQPATYLQGHGGNRVCTGDGGLQDRHTSLRAGGKTGAGNTVDICYSTLLAECAGHVTLIVEYYGCAGTRAALFIGYFYLNL